MDSVLMDGSDLFCDMCCTKIPHLTHFIGFDRSVGEWVSE